MTATTLDAASKLTVENLPALFEKMQADIDDIVDEANILLLGVVSQAHRDNEIDTFPKGFEKLIRKLSDDSADVIRSLRDYDISDFDETGMEQMQTSISDLGSLLTSIAEAITPLSTKVAGRIDMLADRMHHLSDALSNSDD